jgi:hypothetical protein
MMKLLWRVCGFLLALLEDENGINTAGGIGHDITAVLDGDVSNPFVLNDYYQTNTNDFTKGTLRVSFEEYPPDYIQLHLKYGMCTITQQL